MIILLRLVTFSILICFNASIHADDLSKDVPRAYSLVANSQSIPPTVLYVLGLAVSGKTIEKGVRRPWPWTLNVDGRGFYFNSKGEAITAFGKFVKQGANNIGVGLMQVNWQVNGKRYYSNVDDLFNPYNNLIVGADILNACYAKKNDWYAAADCYRDQSKKYALINSNHTLYKNSIEQQAKLNNLDPDFVRAIIQVESNYKPSAVSPKGAVGLMQLMPKTAQRFDVSNSYDPTQNIKGGTKYLRILMDEFNDPKLVLAAYNAGEGNVRKYDGIPNFKETKHYVVKVINIYEHLKNNG